MSSQKHHNEVPIRGPLPDLHPESEQEPDPEQRTEPAVDPDSAQRLAEVRPDPKHGATETRAPDGYGTSAGPPYGQPSQDRPILDGSTQSPLAEATVPNPHRGQVDPGMITKQPALNNTNSIRWLVASIIAAVILIVFMLLLFSWSPLWMGTGITVALVGLLLMLAVRATRLKLKHKLRIDAVLMAIIWLVPLAIILAVMIGSADAIFGPADGPWQN